MDDISLQWLVIVAWLQLVINIAMGSILICFPFLCSYVSDFIL